MELAFGPRQLLLGYAFMLNALELVQNGGLGPRWFDPVAQGGVDGEEVGVERELEAGRDRRRDLAVDQRAVQPRAAPKAARAAPGDRARSAAQHRAEHDHRR